MVVAGFPVGILVDYTPELAGKELTVFGLCGVISRKGKLGEYDLKAASDKASHNLTSNWSCLAVRH